MQEDFLDIYRKNFLNPDESNFNELIDKIEDFHQMLYSVDLASYARIPIKTNFSYREEASRSMLPSEGLSLQALQPLIKEMFEGTVRWHSPNALLNISPSPLLDVVALNTLINLYNPNTLWDFTSGKLIAYEKKVIKFLSDLAGWNHQLGDGLATFGGKATLMYAIKIGISKICRKTIYEGIKDDYIIISSDRAHYSLEGICSYLGIGKKNIVRINTDYTGSMIQKEFINKLHTLLEEKKKVVCIILNAGVTIDFCVDPIEDIINITKQTCEKFGVNYPHFHADSVAGWPWLFFQYNFNNQDIDVKVKSKVDNMVAVLRGLHLADSFSADFHKTGLCPYTSTFFIMREKSNMSLLTEESPLKEEFDSFYEMHVHHYSLENSRSGTGIAAAWLVLNRLGIKGFQCYLLHLLTIGEYFRGVIRRSFSEDFYVVNPYTKGFELVIKIHFFNNRHSWDEMLLADNIFKKNYQQHCNNFKIFLYNVAPKKYPECPLVGFVPKYRRSSDEEYLSCFLIYPMSVYITQETVVKTLALLKAIKTEYENSVNHLEDFQDEKIHILPPR